MSRTIETDLAQYQAATSAQIRLWSSGSVKRRLRPFERREDWRQTQGTLWDARLFGPRESWKCACGKFDGEEFSGTVCNVCGVKVVSNVSRKVRFAHVNLPLEIPHPYFAEAEPLDCVPIIPIVHWETPRGAALAEAYEELVHVSLLVPSREDCVAAYGRIIALLEGLYSEQIEHDEETAHRIARGLALIPGPVEELTPSADQAGGEADDEGEEIDWDNLKFEEDR
jgi:DNA-directed RNA polymerase beta' subunit